MSRPFRFLISAEQDRDFEITGWGDETLEALRDALCCNTTALANHFSLGEGAGFTSDDLCIQERDESDGGGYGISVHPQSAANRDQDRGAAAAWAIHASLAAV